MMVWYAASVILYFRAKSGVQSTYRVWENVYLVHAANSDAARSKAEALGKAEEEEGVEVDGVPADLVFGGVRKIVSCAGDPSAPGGPDVTEIYSGVEATYSSFVVSSNEALQKLLKGEEAAVVYEE